MILESAMPGSESENGTPSGENKADGDHAEARKGPEQETSEPMDPRRKRLNAVIGGAVLLVCVAAGGAYWPPSQHHENTHHAFLDNNQSPIASPGKRRVGELLG